MKHDNPGTDLGGKRHMEIKELVERQRKYFLSGATLSYAARREALENIGRALDQYETKLCDALYQDLHKSSSESRTASHL